MIQQNETKPKKESGTDPLSRTLICFFWAFLVIDVSVIFLDEFKYWLAIHLFPLLPKVIWELVYLLAYNYYTSCIYLFIGFLALSIVITIIPVLRGLSSLFLIILLYFMSLIIQPLFFDSNTGEMWIANITIFVLLILCYLFFVLKALFKKDKIERPKNIFVE